MKKETIAFKIERTSIEKLCEIFQINGKNTSEKMRNLCYALLEKQVQTMHQDMTEKPQYVEKTIEKIVEKTVYKDSLDGLQILCKMGKGYVGLQECRQNCENFMECPYYFLIVVEKKVPEDAKLRFIDYDKIQ